MITNLLFFAAFLAVAYLASLGATRPSGGEARVPVRSERTEDPRRD